jgi:hypothetical protein
MAGLGRKTWSPGDTLTAADVNGYLMEQAVMVFAGTAARSSAIPSPSAGMVAYSTATSLQVYNGSAWVDLSTGYGVATGGASTAITVGGTAYTLLTFTTTSTLTVTKAGLFDVYIFAGGGGGGSTVSTAIGGGGGAGGGVQATVYLSANQTVTIGAGGAALALGTQSSLNPLAVVGGGFGSGYSGAGVNPSIGGCGGGGGFGNTTGAVSSVPLVMGNSGGNAFSSSNGGGGGGGVGAIGSNGTSTTGGAGGAGIDIGSTFAGGSSLFKGGGGGGGGTTGGAGGSSVGGAGGSNAAGSAAAANTASGGGGAAASGTLSGGAGGSGICYVRFKV